MILVTGSTGFLGAELVIQLLQYENQIRCIKRASAIIPDKLSPFNGKIEWINADILDFSDLEDAFEGISKVYHCAALVSFDSSLKNEMLAVNAEGTANVVNLCIAHDIQKLVHVSSIAALGDSKDDELVNETHFWEGFETHNPYAVSKYRAEMEVWRGFNEGLNAVIVNPSVIIGVDTGIEGSGAIFENIKNGLKFYPSGSTGFVDVKDVAKAMILLMDSEYTAERFILNSENYLYKDFFAEVSEEFGIATPVKVAKPWMLSLVWRLNSLKKLFTNKKSGLNKVTANNASKLNKFSNDKIKERLNFEFIPVKESITKIVNSLKSA